MDAVDEVKSRLNIEDVIGEYVELKRAGRNWRGLSPFGNEKTPSFMVSPEKQIWHDFSSGKGGNMFSFVMEMEGLDFKGALELLARKAGVDLEQYRSKGSGARGKEKERLYELLNLAAKFYQVQFSQNQTALAYIFKQRRFTKETALEWRLGYAPNNGSALLDFARSKGFSEAEAKAAGLTARSYRGGTQDMFRGRIMIPLQDAQGRVIGFTARLLADDPDAPKYINTPQTVLYDKSRHVYGLHLAKEAIRKHKFVVLVEGNLDVIASHQAGVRQVVATAGTAMTEHHLQALGRFTGDIRLSFDADKAGLNATERAIPIASKVGVSLSIITIPSGKDPDELIAGGGAETWTKVIQTPQYALDWLIERYKKELDLNSAVGKREFSDIILAVVRRLQDPVEQEHYIEKLANVLGVSKQALLTKLAQANTRPAPRRKTPGGQPRPFDKHTTEVLKTQNHLLALALMQPKLRTFLEPIQEEMLLEDQAKILLNFLKANPDFAGVSSAAQPKSATLALDQPFTRGELTLKSKSPSDHFSPIMPSFGQALHSGPSKENSDSHWLSSGSTSAEVVESKDGTLGLNALAQIKQGGLGETKTIAKQEATTEATSSLRPIADYVKILSLAYEELYQGLELNELHYEVARKQAQLIDQYVKLQKPFLDLELERLIDKPADNPEKVALAQKIEHLNKLRNTYKKGA